MGSVLKGVGNIQDPLEGDIKAYADEALTQALDSVSEASFGEFLETHSGGPRVSTLSYHTWVRNESNRRQGVKISSDNPDVTPIPYGDAGFLFEPDEVREIDIQATYRGSGQGEVRFNFTLTGTLSHLLAS
jgi:hypothetical protein